MSYHSTAFTINYYEILGISQDATIRDINSAYKRLALIHHPDKAGGTDEAVSRFRKIQQAVEILRDDSCRAKHDKDLATQGYYNYSTRTQARPTQRRRPPNPYWWGTSDYGSHRYQFSYGNSVHMDPDSPESRQVREEREQDKRFWESVMSDYYAETATATATAGAGDEFGEETGEYAGEEANEEEYDSYEYNGEDEGDGERGPAFWDNVIRQQLGEEVDLDEEPAHYTDSEDEDELEGEVEEYGTDEEGDEEGEVESLDNYIKNRMPEIWEYMSGQSAGVGPQGEDFVDEGEAENVEQKENIYETMPPLFQETGSDQLEQSQTSPTEYETAPLCDESDSDCQNEDDLISFSPKGSEAGIELTQTKFSNETIFYDCSSTVSPTTNDSELDSTSTNPPSPERAAPGPQPVHLELGPEIDPLFAPFVPYFKAKLAHPSGRYTYHDLHIELRGMIMEIFCGWLESLRMDFPHANPLPAKHDQRECLHLGLWDKKFGCEECENCKRWMPIYTLTCPACGIKACVVCKFQY